MGKTLFCNRRGVELSINFIVILIITVIVFGATMVIAKNILDKGSELKENVDSQTRERLSSLMISGNEEVVIAFPSLEAKRGNSAVFGVGILNKLGETKNFFVNVSTGIIVYANGSEATAATFSGWKYPQTTINAGNIQFNNYAVQPLLIIASEDATKGTTYSFNVKVYYKNATGQYVSYPLRDNNRIIRVTII